MMLLQFIFLYNNFRFSQCSSNHSPLRIFVITKNISGNKGYVGLITYDHCG